MYQTKLPFIAFLIIVCLAGCGEDSGVEQTVSVSVEIDANYGGFLSSEDAANLTVAFPPGAFAADTIVTLSIAEPGVEGALSRKFTLTAANPLLVPVMLAYLAPDADLTWSIARLDNGVVQALPDNQLDPVTNELTASLSELASFVIVDQANTKNVAAATDPSAGFFPSRGGPDGQAGLLEGSWRGTDNFRSYSINIAGARFDILHDGDIVRSGTLKTVQQNLELIDQSGNVDTGTFEVSENAWTLTTSDSGTIHWVREPASQQSGSAAPSGGFFQAADTGAEQQAAEKPQTQTTQAPVAQSASQPEQKRKGFFGRMGDRIKNVGGRVASGVKNIGKNTAKSAEASAERQVAAVEHSVDRQIAASENAVAHQIDQAGAELTHNIDAGVSNVLDDAGLDGAIAPSAPRHGDPCGLAASSELTNVLGQYSQQQLTDSLCRFRGAAGGTVDLNIDWTGGRTRSKSYAAMRRAGTCHAPHNIGNDSCLYNMSNGVRIFFAQRGVDVVVDVRLGPASAVSAEQIARSVALNI